VVDVEAPSPAPAPGALPRELAAEMAKHGLTEADQRLLFGEGIITVERFKGLSDANYPTSIDVGARREAKRQRDQAEQARAQAAAQATRAAAQAAAQARHDQAVHAARERHTAACVEQVRQALRQAQLTDNAPVAAILKRAPDVGALRRLAEDRGALEASGVGAHDRQQLQNFCRGAGLWLAVPVREAQAGALTEPEAERQAQAEAERKAAARRHCCQACLSALLLLCGAAVQQYGWWSLYGDLGLWCGLVGGAAALAGARGRRHNWHERYRGWFWFFIVCYAVCGALATGFSANADCPTTGSWGDRWDRCEDPGLVLAFAFVSLLFLSALGLD
jgi:hypothetical protein